MSKWICLSIVVLLLLFEHIFLQVEADKHEAEDNAFKEVTKIKLEVLSTNIQTCLSIINNEQ